jgi:hypothetical protein
MSEWSAVPALSGRHRADLGNTGSSDRLRPVGRAEEQPLAFDGEPRRRQIECPSCQQSHDGETGFLLRGGSAYAIFFADWYPHAGEAWLDVVLGSFAEPDYPDHVTFGCRIGHIRGQEAPACSLVQAAARRSDSALFGSRLSPDQARGHPRLAEFWAVTDWLILNDQLLHEKVFHTRPASQQHQS